MQENDNKEIKVYQNIHNIIDLNAKSSKDSKNSENELTFNNESQNSTVLQSGVVTSNKNLESMVDVLRNEKINLYGNPIHTVHPYKLGSTYAYIYIKNYPIISFGKHLFKPICLFFIMNIIFLSAKYWLYDKSGIFLQSLFLYSFIIFITTYVFLIFVNPGIPSIKYHDNNLNEIKGDKKKKKQFIKCEKCGLVYKIRDKICHCNKCGVCYYDLILHSDFIGHCIAKNNKYVYFISVISLICFVPSSISMIVVNILKEVIKRQKTNL